LSRSFELLDSDVEVEDAKSPKSFPQSLDGVAFRNLVFSYSETKKVLSGINFSAFPGSITAVVGGTGSGKSTLMSLLLRLYDPEEGSIEINGIDIRDLSVTDLRNNIAIALQQNELFAMTVKENIVYGRSGISDIDIVEACRIACAHEFISALPRGYDTELGERGGKLSTGQKQRISIARAVVRSTPILILDEPTASLDAETERKVIENLARWGKERIVFIITHRLSTIRSADQIILIHEGNISESGTHDELMKNQGPYRDFVDAELGLRAKN
jgi:ATP-binding cassette subfamily B protein